LTRALIVPYLLLAFLTGVGNTQESHSPKSATASGNSTSTPSNEVSLPAERVIIKVGSTQVTAAEFETRISDIEPQGEPDKAGSIDKDRRKLGDDYASVLMLSQQAIANHLDSSPEVSRQLAIDHLQILSDAEFARLLSEAQPTPGEINQYYSAHLSDYDEVQIRRLFIFKTGGNSENVHGLTPQDARARADAILQASAAGRNANKLAEEFKDSENGLLDAEPSPLPRREVPRKIERVAFALKEGEWSEVEDTPNSVLLLQLVRRRRQPLAEVSSLIEQRLQGQKMQAKLDDLKKKTGIWMDEQYFGTAVAPVPGVQRPVSNPPSKLRKSAGKKEERTNENVRPE
jgi:hypothetical protein